MTALNAIQNTFIAPHGQLVAGNVAMPITLSMLLNPPSLVAFWKACLDDRTEFKADALINLPVNTYILGIPAFGSQIYVRRCYPALWDVCLNKIHDKKTNTPHLVVLGNPGIGKTYFGFMILLLLARAGESVVYESGVLGRRFLLTTNMVAEGSQNDFNRILSQTTTYYIVDGVKPLYCPAKTILVTSPRRSIWFEFNKTNSQTCYMPVWTMQEVLKCRELMYTNVSEVIVQDCFHRWGGIARYVLHYAN
ncbi:crinkler (CRN) family protein, partial [Thraustotheca clavata]